MNFETFFAVLIASNIFDGLVRISAVDLWVTCLSCCRYGVTGALPRAVAKAQPLYRANTIGRYSELGNRIATIHSRKVRNFC